MAFDDVWVPRPYDSALFLGFGLAAQRRRHSGISDYRPNRSHTQDLGQINEPAQAYMERKLAEFIRARPKTAKRMGLRK